MELIAAQLPTHYQRIGKGPIIVLLHGWGCDWQIFSPIISALSEQYQLLIPDLPAFGQSHSPQETWGTPEYRHWLEDFLTQTIGNKKFALLGHSYGGKLAAVYTAQGEGPQPSHLILCDASGIPSQLSLTKRLQQRVLKGIPAQLKHSLSQRLREKLLAMSGSSSDHFYATPAQKKILVVVVKEDIRSQLSNIHIPTLLIWGDRDPDTPLNHAVQFQKRIPGSELSTFSDVGHFPFIEQPARFIREVVSFYQP